eukprot:4227800-Prymnesium_polylepis.1
MGRWVRLSVRDLWTLCPVGGTESVLRAGRWRGCRSGGRERGRETAGRRGHVDDGHVLSLIHI